MDQTFSAKGGSHSLVVLDDRQVKSYLLELAHYASQEGTLNRVHAQRYANMLKSIYERRPDLKEKHPKELASWV